MQIPKEQQIFLTGNVFWNQLAVQFKAGMINTSQKKKIDYLHPHFIISTMEATDTFAKTAQE